MIKKQIGYRKHLVSILIATASFLSPVVGQTVSPTPTSLVDARRHPTRRMPQRAQMFFESAWGVDSFVVKTAESGELIRFSYRVVDPEKAKPLFDKKQDPALYDERAHVRLVVPSLEKVGALRQTSSNPVEGQSYWMAFSNSGRPVKKGDRVSVVIGRFHVDGLFVQ